MKFQVIVADPPWSFSDRLNMSDVKRGAEAQYKTMSSKLLSEMKVKEISDSEGAVLALWVPSSLLQSGLDVMNAWGFEHKQTYVWVKTKKEIFLDFRKWIKKHVLKHPQVVYDKFAYDRGINAILKSFNNIVLYGVLAFGMGRLFRQTHELCLIGINNKGIYKRLKNKSQRSVSFCQNYKHSKKPDNLQKSLELMFPDANKIELFARRELDGWVCIGDEVCNGEDINDSLGKYL